MSTHFLSSMASSVSSFRMQSISVTPLKITKRNLPFKLLSQIALHNKEDENGERRTANYKPSIWKYDQLQSLSTEYDDAKYQTKAKKLVQDLRYMFTEVKDQTAKLQLIDSISKLGLADYFEMEIKESLDSIVSSGKEYCSINREGLYATALCFRLLRQHGYYASQDMFLDFFDSGKLISTVAKANVEELLELFEASHLGTDGENILAEARLLCMESLQSYATNSDHTISTKVSQALSLPLHWRVEWFNFKRHIHEHEMERKYPFNFKLIELAKVNFNILQSRQQQDLKEAARWWLNVGIMENMDFCRDRMVESFMFAAGVAFEHQHTNVRRWLSKVLKLTMVIDDVYDVYGTLEELECFTNAVVRWNPEDVKDLPESLKICFWTLYNTTNEIAMETENENCWTSVLPYLQQTWIDFCKAMLMESKWYNNGYTPSLQEYLNNGWISSSGPLLSLHTIFFVANPRVIKDIPEFLKESHDIIYHSSLIIRLCNDLGTSTAELERGDAPSSILCYMKECNVNEEAAREHIRSIIIESWRKINNCYTASAAGSTKSSYLNNYIINGARMAHLIYQHGDGFGIQGKEATTEVLSNIIEPILI